MKTSKLFTPSTAEVQRLVSESPFGLLVSTGVNGPIGTPLPFLMIEEEGKDPYLLGHMARHNPHVDALRSNPRALIVIMGVNGYISPSWLSDKTQAPTWNYETVHFDAQVQFDDSPTGTDSALEQLVSHMETGRNSTWSIDAMGARYGRLAGAVVAFRAKIIATNAKFKLGQNEAFDTYQEILDGLKESGERALADAMRRANQDRQGVVGT